MKKNKILFLLSFLLFAAAGYSQQGTLTQQQYNAIEDSVTSKRVIDQMKQFISISAAQETAVHDVVVTNNAARRNVFQQYWGTASFQQEIATVEQQRDSLFQTILGATDFALYHQKMEEIRQQREEELRARAQQNQNQN